MKIDGEEIPRILYEQLAEDVQLGRYPNDVDSYVRVRYRAFRTAWSRNSNMEAPSLARWLRNVRAVEEGVDSAQQSQESNTLKNLRK